mgnify:FL=1|jgi:hypothetical protein
MNTAIAPMPSELINAYTDFYFAAPNVAALEESLGISLNDPPEGVYVDYIGKAEKTPPIYSNDDPENATIVTPATYYDFELVNIRISSFVIPDKFVNSKFLIPEPKTPVRVWF